MSEKKPNVLHVKDRAPAEPFSHPFSPRSQVSGVSLSDATGLQRAEELVYLAGGERRGAGIADYPEQGKRMVPVGGQVAVYPLAAGESPFPGLPKL